MMFLRFEVLWPGCELYFILLVLRKTPGGQRVYVKESVRRNILNYAFVFERTEYTTFFCRSRLGAIVSERISANMLSIPTPDWMNRGTHGSKFGNTGYRGNCRTAAQRVPLRIHILQIRASNHSGGSLVLRVASFCREAGTYRGV